MGLDHLDRVFAYLNKAGDELFPLMTLLKTDPFFHPCAAIVVSMNCCAGWVWDKGCVFGRVLFRRMAKQ